MQFVNFTEIMSKDIPQYKKETEFALAALMEIPMQYKATVSHQLLGQVFLLNFFSVLRLLNFELCCTR